MFRRTTVFAAAFFVAVPLVLAQNPVKFQVNMRVKILSGLFHVGTDSVTLRGDFNSWLNTSMTKGASDSIYSVTVDMPDSLVGTVQNYKFWGSFNGGTWEGTVTSNPNGNRSFTLQLGGQDLPVVYFNNDSTLAIAANILFQIDMSVMESAGYFMPDSGDVVNVGGNVIPNAWNGTALAADSHQPGVYSKSISVTASPGSQVEYKYFIVSTRTATPVYPNGGWETINNSQLIFQGRDTTIAPRYFDDKGPSIVLSQQMSYIFSVDMRNSLNFRTALPFPSIDTVYITGSESPLFWIWDSPNQSRAALRLYDDGTHGDLTAGDSIYSGTITFPAGSIRAGVTFGYSVAYHPGQTTFPENNESALQQNHAITLPDSLTSPVRLTTNKFGDVSDITTGIKLRQTSSFVPSQYRLDQNYPNPFNPTTQIRYAVVHEGFVSLKVYNILGQVVDVLVSQKQTPGEYAAAFDGSTLASGIYFYRLESGSFNSTRKMLLLK